MSIPFENLADPIISGREELSMPKLYTAINAHEQRDGYLFMLLHMERRQQRPTLPKDGSLKITSCYSNYVRGVNQLIDIFMKVEIYIC
jgi:hypothetical protein